MAGRIRDEDIKRVRDASPIADVIGEHVTLRSAGGGNLKGLCPFHDEKTPSFNVTPSRGVWYCFGCSEGGDVIAFAMRIDHLSFAEAVERLAGRAGVELRYEESGYVPRQQQGQRTRLVEAHKAAAEFFAEQLTTPEAEPGRRFLSERGFDADVAARFGVGYAPRSWDTLVGHLRGRGFTDRELLAGGLASEGRRGPIDRFRGRLIWPIRDIAGDVVGFGARRLHDDDQSPKYLNTPETPIFKKSSVLYGADLAKREIAKRAQVVVVEGYTDVMACHLADVPTAVATCGTAFGPEHIKIVRRLLLDQKTFRGEVIFTFDGDEAGQEAARRAFDHDQLFVTQTYVAVERSGLDPCELRQRHGDAAVRDLVARRVPLFEFAIRGAIRGYRLDTDEGQIAALDAAAPILTRIKDWSLRQRYKVKLSGWLGLVDEELVARRVAQAGRGGGGRRRTGGPAARGQDAFFMPDPNDPVLRVEREALKIAIQWPGLAGPVFDGVEAQAFTAPPYAAVRSAIAAAGGTANAAAGEEWVARIREHAADDTVRSLITELAVEELRAPGEPDTRYAQAQFATVQEAFISRRVTEVKARVQRLSPVEHPEEYNRLFGELIALEQHRIRLRQQAVGAL